MVLPDPRATRCPEHAAERRRELRRAANATYYDEMRVLADAGLSAAAHGDAAIVPGEAVRRLADAAQGLRQAVVAMDRAVNDPPDANDPRGEFRIGFARRRLRNQADAVGALIARIMRDLTL